ncbi:MAG: AAA family ATPase [Syntrophales bacterium]
MDQFEEQVRGADGQITEKTLADCLVTSILSEDALKNLEIKPIKKYLGPICEGSLGEIYGPRGIGKTILRDVISICLTRNRDLGPFKCENPAGVLIFDGEMSLHLLKDRNRELTQNVCAALKPLDTISNEHLYRSGLPIINLANKLWRDAVIKLIMTMGDRWDVIIFDNLSSFLPGIKENDQEAWGPINEFLLQLRWLRKAVIFIHHAGKSGDQRGTSGREDQLDFVLKLTLPAGYDPEEGCRFDATLTKTRSFTGPEAAPFTFEITTHPKGGLTWIVTSQREQRKELIIALLGNGTSQKDAANIAGVSKGYVSQIRKQAINQKLLNPKGTNLTPTGLLKYGDFDIEKYTG